MVCAFAGAFSFGIAGFSGIVMPGVWWCCASAGEASEPSASALAPMSNLEITICLR
jgi:hypothetical protein